MMLFDFFALCWKETLNLGEPAAFLKLPFMSKFMTCTAMTHDFSFRHFSVNYQPEMYPRSLATRLTAIIGALGHLWSQRKVHMKTLTDWVAEFNALMQAWTHGERNKLGLGS